MIIASGVMTLILCSVSFLLASDVYVQYNSKYEQRESMVYTYCAVMREWLTKFACGVDMVKSTNRDWRLKGCGIVKEQL